MTQAQPELRFQHPELPTAQQIDQYLQQSREAGWYSNFGPCHELLAQRISAMIGPGTAVLGTSSGTSALQAAILATGAPQRQPGGIALMPSFTFAATATAAIACGLKPHFVDIDIDGWHLDPDAVASAIEQNPGRIAAVIACSPFGSPPPSNVVTALAASCRSADVPLIFDSAAGFGARNDDGELAGRQGDVEIFSFHATKPFAIGEGGLIISRNQDLINAARKLINFDFDRQREIQSEFGFNGKMSETSAATACCVLDHYDSILERRRTAAGKIVERLIPLGFKFCESGANSTWQFVPCLCEDEQMRNQITSALAPTVGIRTYYRPLHTKAVFARYGGGALPITEEVAARIICLPMYNGITADQIEQITDSVARARSSTA